VAWLEGRVFPGADDNISGLVGSYYFVQHCPVPVEKISANLNLDMISRNATNHIVFLTCRGPCAI
jgi:Zn-dependent M28 family amino/carboxypeptidase